MSNKLTQSQVADICTLYKQGKTQVELSAQFGIAQPNIRYVLLREGVELRPKNKLTAQQIAEIGALHTLGHSQQSIADRFGISPNTVKYHIVRGMSV